MAFIIKFVKGVRNHWKKSTFAACAIAYGSNYAYESYQIQELMRKYCEEASKYGLQPLLNTENPRKVIVILNPTANRRKAAKQFEQYCAPILHLAGICVDVIQTKTEGHARTLVEELKENTNALVIAGGDGTISECVTGLMRRVDCNIGSYSIGILPLGRVNSYAQTLFKSNNSNKSIRNVQTLADASMAIVREHTKQTNVMKIELLPDDNNELKNELINSTTNKPVYALSGLQWGSYRDAIAAKDKYWYFGTLRNYVTFIFNGLKSSLTWDCNADITFSPPCSGCSNCYHEIEVFNKTNTANIHAGKRWWGSFIPKAEIQAQQSANLIKNTVNENCFQLQAKHISTTDLSLTINNDETVPKLLLNIGPEASNVSYTEFVEQGWKTQQGKMRNIKDSFELRQIKLIPKVVQSEKEIFYSIDNENYEVKPVKITLLPKILRVFCN